MKSLYRRKRKKTEKDKQGELDFTAKSKLPKFEDTPAPPSVKYDEWLKKERAVLDEILRRERDGSV